ncbi:TPA: hypothetical protein ACK0LO_000057 [Providencia stuartii]
MKTVHSANFNSFYQQIDELFTGDKLGVFARQIKEWFDEWGNEYSPLEVGQKWMKKGS